MIYRLGIVRDSLVNAIDTCRIFETSFDLWDGDGDGWNVLRFAPNWHERMSTTETETLAALCSWFVESSSPDIKDNLIEDMVWGAIFNTNDDFADFIDLLLGLSPPKTLHDDAGLLQHHSDLLLHHVIRQNWKIVNLLLASGADPHLVDTDRYNSPVAESPLSLAMYSSWMFWGFRNALHGRELDIKDFAREELEEGRPLLDAGWQMETLTVLLELEFEPDIALYNGRPRHWCDSCTRDTWYDLYSSDVMVQPYWQSFVESIKSGASPHDFSSITPDEQPPNSHHSLTVLNESTTDAADDSALSQDPALSEDQAAHPNQESPTNGVDISSTIFDRREIWCIKCWYHFKETGLRRTPASKTESTDEDDFSPYLFNT